VLKIITSDTINLIFKLQLAFCQLQTITLSECCLIKLLLYILFEKYIYILALKMASPGNQHRPTVSIMSALTYPFSKKHETFSVFYFSVRVGVYMCILKPCATELPRAIIRLYIGREAKVNYIDDFLQKNS